VREANAAVKLAQEELDRYQALASTGAVSQSQITKKTAAFEVAVTRLQQTQAAVNPSRAAMEIAAEKVEQGRARGAATVATVQKEQSALIQQQIGLWQEYASKTDCRAVPVAIGQYSLWAVQSIGSVVRVSAPAGVSRPPGSPLLESIDPQQFPFQSSPCQSGTDCPRLPGGRCGSVYQRLAR